LGFVDNGCKYVNLTALEAASNPPAGSADPRLRSCPHNIEHLSPTWGGSPSAAQAQIYTYELQLFPPDITFAEAATAMQAALGSASS
jgi:hypothetical protein